MRTAARFVITLAALAALPAKAQTILEPTDRTKFNTLFDQFKGDPLKCNVHTEEPWVDFGFRFELRYTVDCEIRQFGGSAAELKAFLRVRPEEGSEIILGEQFAVPAAPKRLADEDLRRMPAMMEFSGALAAGIGVYDMELLLVDDHNRIYRRHWKAKAFPNHRESNLNFSMLPNTLAPLHTTPIPIRSSGGGGGQLTVLINAAPLNPWSRKLRAWDRAFLLDSLSSLLRQLSYSSVRVVAFNLEQQQEIFRKENFTEPDMRQLARALRSLELGAVAYSTLQRKEGWAELLLGLLQEEKRTEQPSNAVVFLGPTLRLDEKVPLPILASHETLTLPLFCVAYYPRMGADFPDSIQHLTTALKGKVFRIHSPSELAQNLEKLQREIQTDASARTMRPLK
jgi:hypothetical protein